jgi:uncharacterized protein (DUF1501 family)
MTIDIARRKFLKTASLLSIAGAGAPFALNLAAIGSAAAQSTGDYRALVCLFLSGGNDHSNTVIPYDSASYAEYQTARASVALPRESLAATQLGAVASQGGRAFALHPELTNVKALWDQGRTAIVANVGPLVVPTTLAQFRSRSVPLPPKLGSHNDQTSVWQAFGARGEDDARVGWGGRIGDLLASRNADNSFTCISAAGNTVWLAGEQVLQYRANNGGALHIAALQGRIFGQHVQPLMRELITRPSAHHMEDAYSATVSRAIAASEKLQSAYPPASVFSTPTPSGALAEQLNTVARMIHARSVLGMRRQVFFVSFSGFDNHSDLVPKHQGRMAELNAAVGAFWNWLVEMNVATQVTLFTASEFGRTLTSNSNGSDHGWGSHHLVIGGAVRGRSIYGQFPPVVTGHSLDVNRGRLLPSTAVDQYAATLARWMGVADSDMTRVLPNVGNFGTSRYLGFMG